MQVLRTRPIVEGIINNGVTFLRHLKNDHEICYAVKRMIASKEAAKGAGSRQKIFGSK
jgi:hypothetical protein